MQEEKIGKKKQKKLAMSSSECSVQALFITAELKKARLYAVEICQAFAYSCNDLRFSLKNEAITR